MQTTYNLDGSIPNVKRAVGTALGQTYAAYTYTLNGLLLTQFAMESRGSQVGSLPSS